MKALVRALKRIVIVSGIGLGTGIVIGSAACGGDSPKATKPVEPEPEPVPTPEATVDLIELSVNSPDRPADDRERDVDRKPAEVMRFFGIEPGMTVVELMTGRGYYAELLGRAVGAEGTVYAHNNKFVLERFAEKPISERLARPGLENVKRWDHELTDLAFKPDTLDVALMILFYHDTIWFEIDRDAMNKQIFSVLKPGGVFGVIDHVAADGAGDVSKTLHRIEPKQIIDEVTAAGFVLEEESDVLRHPEDDHQTNVFDDSIRGKTDRVVLRFRKPR